MKIYGAGLAGLLAGCHFQKATILEAAPEESVHHKAVLRFRTSAVGDSVGVDFRKVRVHKGIWHDGKPAQPSIMLANQYSEKVIGRMVDRSIWNIDPVDRFIAPEDFIAELADRCHGRIAWNYEVGEHTFLDSSERAISTLPLSVACKILNVTPPEPFIHAPITVKRWRVPGADVFQTIYFPDPNTTLYRASITGDLLIAEYAGEVEHHYNFFNAFWLDEDDLEPIEQVSQRYGKIAPIDDAWRKEFIFNLTTKHNIFSLGRFGTWRNLLLDDVLHDISVLKKLMKTSTYERSKINVA